MKKIGVGILGVSGLIGQYYLHLLENHPWFEINFIATSEEGTYQEKVINQWLLSSPPPDLSLKVYKAADVERAKESCSLIFSALPTAIAASLEPQYAKAGIGVVSNASTYRMDEDVPLIIPEINASHLGMIALQKKNRGWDKGFIVAKPNCALQSFLLPLAPLHHKFKLQKLQVTTLQALSGAGIHGPSGLVVAGNVLPHIEGEEDKLETEPLKILGKLSDSLKIATSPFQISSHCTRVPVIDGHLACVSAQFETEPDLDQIQACWSNFNPLSHLPFSPKTVVRYRKEADRPQQRLDATEGRGMAVTVGRLRTCPLHHIRFVALSHNAIRGGAGGGILTAELLVHHKWVS